MAEILYPKLPLMATSSSDKIEYYYQVQEALRLVHNAKGKDYRDGKITKQEFEDWVKNYFNPREIGIVKGILENRELLKKSVRFSVNLDNDFEINP